MSKTARPGPSLDDVLLALRDSLIRYWKRVGFSHDRAEDLAQEGILKCLEAISKFRGEADLKTFLTTVAKRRGIEVLRKEARRAAILQKASEDGSLTSTE